MLQKGPLTYACGPGMEGSKASTLGDEGPGAVPFPVNSNHYSPDTVTLRLQYMSDKVTRVSGSPGQCMCSSGKRPHPVGSLTKLVLGFCGAGGGLCGAIRLGCLHGLADL